MKIIADTNIWYHLGQENELYEKVKEEPISPNYVNIYELSKSYNLINHEELSREAIKMLLKFKDNVIYEPPFIYIATLHQSCNYDQKTEIGDLLDFTSSMAKGLTINKADMEELKLLFEKLDLALSYFANFMNESVEKFRQKKINKIEYKKKDTYKVTAALINVFVESSTKNQCNLNGFDLNKIELLMRTLDHLNKTLVTSKMKFEKNDWFDLSILGYVQPGDKYWTKEKKWIRLIKEAGCEEYLYKP
jgi:hypothetical protein